MRKSLLKGEYQTQAPSIKNVDILLVHIPGAWPEPTFIDKLDAHITMGVGSLSYECIPMRPSFGMFQIKRKRYFTNMLLPHSTIKLQCSTAKIQQRRETAKVSRLYFSKNIVLLNTSPHYKRSFILSTMSAMVASPVTLHAVPKLSMAM